MKKIYILLVVAIILFILPAIIYAADYDKKALKEIVQLKASYYEVSAPLMEEMITCESQWQTTLQSKHIYPRDIPKVGIKKGTRERSFGPVQINLDWNPGITRKQAEDPHFAFDFLARKLSEGKGYLWSCFPKPMKQIKK